MPGGGQILPGDDNFTEGSPTYGDELQRFTAIQPFAGADATTGYTLVFGFGHFFDGYSGDDGFPESCAAATKYSTAAADSSVWNVYREFSTDDIEVKFQPELIMIDGSAGVDTFRACGLCARVSGGTFTTPAGGDHSDKYYRNVSGYFFIQAKQSGLPHKLFLLRLDAGAITVLASKLVGDLLGGNLYGSPNDEAKLPLPMRMTIDQPAGTATIKCYRRQFVQAAGGVTTIGGAPAISGVTEDLVFNVSDASPVASGGRFGFGIQLAKAQTAGDSVVVCRGFDAIDTDAGTLLLRDRFRRRMSAVEAGGVIGAARGLLDPLSKLGNSLGTSFTGDSQGESSSAFKHYGHLKRDAGNNAVTVGATPPTGSGQVHGWYIGSRPADSMQQHRSVILNVINATTETVRCGIHLRGQWFPATSFDFRARVTVGGAFRDYRKQGYLCIVKFVPGGSPVWQLEIRAHRKGGDPLLTYRSTLLATVDLTSAGLAVGTPFTLDFEVRNFDVAVTGFGQWPACRAKLNGSVLTPVIDSGVSTNGVVENDDWIIDMRSEAPDNGRLEGFYVDVDAVHASGLVRVDTWKQETLSDPPAPAEDDQDSVVLAAETAELTGSLVTPLSWPVAERWLGIVPVRHRFETGQLQTFPRAKGIRRRWSVLVRGATRAERVVVRDFFNSHKSIEIPFNWTHPGTGVINKVRFLGDRLAHEMLSEINDGLEGYAFELEEVFDQTIFNEELA